MLKDTRILTIANVPAHLPGGSEFASYENELCKMTLHFELLTRKFL